jgi:hypothetical protein
MRKSLFGLVVAGATLAGAIGSAGPAGAVNYVYDNVTYHVTTISGTWDSVERQVTLESNALLYNDSLASGLANVVGDSLGLPNGISGPLFAYGLVTAAPDPALYFLMSYQWTSDPNPSVNRVDNLFLNLNEGSNTYATATAVPVPWETDALSVIGSTILFAGGLWARNKFAKPLQK